MRMTESKLRRTIRKAILINEGAKKLAKQIKKYVNRQHEQNPIDALKVCTPEALQAKFQQEGYSETEIADAFSRLDDKDYLHRDGKKQWFQKPY